MTVYLISVALIVVLIGTAIWFIDYDAAAAVSIVAVIIIFIFLIVYGSADFGAWYGEIRCDAYGESSERVVKFSRYTHWDWDCLVDTPDGWVVRENVWSGDRP